MTINPALRGIAGFFILLSLVLAWKINGIDLTQPSWLWFTAFIGLNNLQSAFTNTCPMKVVLKKAGMPE